MRHLRLFQSAAVCLLAIALTSAATPARAADLSISGTFYNHQLQGAVGPDLAAVLANNSGRWWTLTAHGVSYSNDFLENEYYDYYGYYHYESQSITRLHATSFDLEFFGPDAAVLEAAVSQQLTAGSLDGGALLEMRNVYRVDEYSYYYYYSSYFYYQTYSTWSLALAPANPSTGVSFSTGDGYLEGYSANYPPYYLYFPLPTDANGYPMVVPQRLFAEQSTIADKRSGNDGSLLSYGDVVDIGSTEPPLPPTLTIADASKLEGQRGSNSVQLTVTLSRTTSNAVTVAYRTVNGTASTSTKDYVATSGTLTIPAGQLQGTITVQITPDRKREANETFTVQLSNPVNATISDGTATVTILNDD